jgi:lycopene cyclase CruA
MTAVLSSRPARKASPDLSDFRRHYPFTVSNLAALPNREAWLGRIWDLEERWQQSLNLHEKQSEVVINSAPPSDLPIEGDFDILYAGGSLGLLHAAVMATRYKRRVMVFDSHVVGRTSRDWNISDEELREFDRAGLFTKDEIEAAIINRYRSGFVKFHDATSRVKAPPLWIDGILDVAVNADSLLSLAVEKIEHSDTGSLVINGARFVRCWVRTGRVVVEVEDSRTSARRGIRARLFVDATGTNSAVSKQLNGGASITHVCPTVGTVAKGFVRGEEPDTVDFSVGEILVSNEDAGDFRQLIWEGFAGSPQKDEYTTYLFFYDAVSSAADKSLLGLFERYFETLPRYKRPGAHWKVVKPVFGYIPSLHHRGRSNHRVTANDRVMLVGDASGPSSPLTFSGFGPHVRNLTKLTTLTERALLEDALDALSLSLINAGEPRVAPMASLAEFMRPTAKSAPSAVNETLNAVMQALHSLDERVRRELFQDRISFSALKNLLGRTARLYPQVFERAREHLGVRGTFWWLVNVAEAAWNERRDKKVEEGRVEREP